MVIKCKMCGGDLLLQEGCSTAECEYCGSLQTVPTAQDEQLQNLFNRANLLRRRCEFDKAEHIYEKIVQTDPTQAEAYWGLVLCKFGIEYVEDPATLQRIPTCHRTNPDPIMTDEDYLAALENADMSQKRLYAAEGREIDRLQKEILALSQKESPYDVFLCYKETDEAGKRTPDSVIANDIYYQLTQEGYKVFYAAITLEDKLGMAYEPCIFAALSTARIMLVIGTRPEFFSAVWVRNEWSRFLKMMKKDRSKLLIPCYKDMDAYELPEEFAHLQAQDMGKIGFMTDVLRGIRKLLTPQKEAAPTPQAAPAQQPANQNTAQLILDGNALYEGQVFAGIPHGFGKAQYPNGDVYEGNWNRGHREGQGNMIWHQGGQWTGQFRQNNLWEGSGISYITAKDGVVLCYDGEYKEGNRNGFGKMVYTDATYEGQWVNNKRHGQGKMLWDKGGTWEGQFQDNRIWTGSGVVYTTAKTGETLRYEGQYENGTMHGFGIMQYTDGRYEGQWLNGKRHGQGKLIYDKGGQWSGEFRDNEVWKGSGVIYTTTKDGTTRYEGQYENGVKQGFGIMQYTDGRYEGQWLNGKRHGQGKLTYDKGGQWSGKFRDNERWNGEGILYYTDGRYIGPIVSGERNGQGKFIWDKGGTWEGRYVNDKRWNGHGAIYYDEGCYYGPLTDGKRNGQGRFVWNDGSTWEGTFKNGEPWNGKGTWYNGNTPSTGLYMFGKYII